MEKLISPIASTLGVNYAQVKNTLELLAEGNTIPFIARYRKEVTKGLDEEQIRYIDEQYQYQKNLAKRKEDVKRLIETQGKITPELIAQIDACETLAGVETEDTGDRCDRQRVETLGGVDPDLSENRKFG